jgi:flagellar biosynthesis/type III secretory pathway M-ring protein FliF/YscJ
MPRKQRYTPEVHNANKFSFFFLSLTTGITHIETFQFWVQLIIWITEEDEEEEEEEEDDDDHDDDDDDDDNDDDDDSNENDENANANVTEIFVFRNRGSVTWSKLEKLSKKKMMMRWKRKCRCEWKFFFPK